MISNLAEKFLIQLTPLYFGTVQLSSAFKSAAELGRI
jgi:hypothetical protein